MSSAKEQIISKKSHVIDRIQHVQAANSSSDDVKAKPQEPKQSSPWAVVVMAAVIAAFATYMLMQTQVVAPLEEAIAQERAQKVAYMTADQLDFKTLEPRIRELEASNAAKAKKEAILIATIDQLSAELEKFTTPFEDVPATTSAKTTPVK